MKKIEKNNAKIIFFFIFKFMKDLMKMESIKNKKNEYK